MLDQITPVILTYNEAPNIERTLERLAWARDIVVLDSFSDDETLAIADRTPRVRVFQREFDCHENQWNFALKETGISSEWVLALDADYLLTPELVEELNELRPEPGTGGYRTRFVYCVNGRGLRGSTYPPVTVLYRRQGARYEQDGHTQRVLFPGDLVELRAPILHDDRKSFDHWLRAQARYMKLEANKLARSDWRDLGWSDRLRKLRVVAPLAILFYCLFAKGLILDGRAGFYYAFQRMLSEMLLSLYLLEQAMLRPSNTIVAEGDKESATLAAARQTEEARAEHS
jgi:glycosyltransferase involved in cell wall biosynthesis